VADARWRSLVGSLNELTDKGAAPASGVQMPRPSAASQTPTRTRSKWLGWAAAAATVVIAAGIAWYLHGRSAGTATTTIDASIAVLPLDDMSPTKDQQYFADGIAEEILNSLARIPNLRVTARNSSFAFKGKTGDLKAIGKTLGVAYLLEGSLRKSGDQLRITAQLIRADTGFHVWSKTYDRQRADVFAVQEDIARSVAEALQVSLGVGLGQQSGMTRNIEAYDAYLVAQALPQESTRETQQRRIDLLLQAVQLDPSFALGWLALGFAYDGMPGVTNEDTQGWQQKGEAAYKEHERLLPGSPAIQYRLAILSQRQSHWKEAAEHYAAAERSDIKLFGAPAEGPSGADNWLLISVGRLSAARAQLELHKARDPLDQTGAWYLAWVIGAAGDYPASFAEFERGDRLTGPEQSRVRALAWQMSLGTRDRAQIVHWLDGLIALAGQAPDVQQFATFKKLLDRPAEALALLHTQFRNPSIPPNNIVSFANTFAYFGDNDAALAALRASFERRALATGFIMWGPALRDVRRMPGFKQLMRDFGFVEYWRAYGWADLCKPVGSDDFECH
jgi:TolB-like protein